MTDDVALPATTPFSDPRTFVALPRLAGLALSPDGTRLVTSMSTLDPTGTRYRSALWQIDPAGEAQPRRLTRSSASEQQFVFAPTGELLFTSARPNPDVEPQDDVPAALWSLPTSGEAAPIIACPGGVSGVHCAKDSGQVVLSTPVMPSAETLAADAEARSRRKKAKVDAILHTAYPVRYWDHDLGPDEERLFALAERALSGAQAGGPAAADAATDADSAAADGDSLATHADSCLTALTPSPGRALDETIVDVSPDGRTVVAGWYEYRPVTKVRRKVVAIDVATGELRVLFDRENATVESVTMSPDGRWVAVVWDEEESTERAPDVWLTLVPLAGGEPRELASSWDRWPGEIAWLPDSSGLFVTADDHGRRPIFVIDLAAPDEPVRLTDEGAFTNPCVAPDGSALYALRNSYLQPPTPVRLDAPPADGSMAARWAGAGTVAPSELPSPAPAVALPGTLTEITATAEDGTPLRAWLALPEGAGADHPAPLALWVHGGPLSSWNSWTWRWCPWVLVAQGYAVLLPDPALSTGYGQDFIGRGWNAWGDAPYTDAMTMTDAAIARPDIDQTRTAMMGGSFGGYMANWIAGHTDRFKAIVSHASLWNLPAFKQSTDMAPYWDNELSPDATQKYSPHWSAEKIVTPMLVIHGDKDYRVPISEGVSLWAELQRYAGAEPSAHRFLYFPSENHWVLAPNHAILWYETVLTFLAVNVLGEQRPYPDLLG